MKTDFSKEIIRKQPFKKIVVFKGVKPVLSRKAISGQTFKATGSDGKLYKINVALNVAKAIKREKKVKMFSHIFPRFYGRNGKYLLFEWKTGIRELTKKENPKVYRKLGHIFADIHNANKTGRKNIPKFFKDRLGKIPDAVLTKAQKVKVLDRFKQFDKKIRYDIVLDLQDAHPANFMIAKHQKIYFVDVGGTGYQVKGFGIARMFTDWLNPKQRKAFWKGYTERHSGDYFDKDYEKFVKLLQTLRAIAFRTGRRQPRKDYAKELKILKEICGLRK